MDSFIEWFDGQDFKHTWAEWVWMIAGVVLLVGICSFVVWVTS